MPEPFWSRIAFLGIPNRRWAIGWMLFSIALAVASIAYSYWDRRFLFGAVFLFSTLWYALAIRYRDRHNGWK